MPSCSSKLILALSWLVWSLASFQMLPPVGLPDGRWSLLVHCSQAKSKGFSHFFQPDGWQTFLPVVKPFCTRENLQRSTTGVPVLSVNPGFLLICTSLDVALRLLSLFHTGITSKITNTKNPNFDKEDFSIKLQLPINRNYGNRRT